MASRAKKKAVKRAPRSRIRGYMFDLDGTLVLGDRSGKSYDVLPGAIETLGRLKEQGIPYVVLTNGSAQPPPSQAAKLRGVGLPVEDSQMLTPSSVTAATLGPPLPKSTARIQRSPMPGRALRPAARLRRP